MNRRQQKKATKQAWPLLTMRVKLRNGKIRKRTCKMGGYSHYEKIIHPAINKQVVRTVMASAGAIALFGGYWVEIEAYRNAEVARFGYNNGYSNRHLLGGLL